MKSRSYKLTIPFAPDTINSAIKFGNSNNLAVGNLKLKWQDLAVHYLQEGIQVGDIPDRFDFPVRVTFWLYFTKKRTRDEDNYYVMSKGIIDALTELRMVRDDADAYVSFGGIHLSIDSESPRVIFEIQEEFPFNVSDANGVLIHEYYE